MADWEGGTAPTTNAAGTARAGRALVRGSWILLACGLLASGLGGWLSYRTRLTAAESRFERSAEDVGAALAEVLRRNTDFVALLRAEIGLRANDAGDPAMTNAEFAEWLRAADVTERYQGGIGYGYIQRVPAERLDVVLDRMASDPVIGLGFDPALGLFPPGERPHYCLFRLTSLLGEAVDQWTAGPVDACAGLDVPDTLPLAHGLQLAMETGETTVSPPAAVSFMDDDIVAMFAPIYRGGGTPATVEERERQLLGWAAATFDPDALVSAGLSGRDELCVSVYRTYTDGTETLVTHTHDAPADREPWSRTILVPMDDGNWKLVITTLPTLPLGDQLTAAGTAVAGAAVAVLLFLLVWLPARSRARALAMVETTTAELRHMALHDALTGLPNRALVMDELERVLATGGANGGGATGGARVAVLYVDLDKFKDVNDTLGHGAGDELLCAASRRLVGAVRDTDTVGRLGGDEFVVLLAPGGGDPTPWSVAERIIEVFEAPFELTAAPGMPIGISVSIGIASDGSASAGELLRDADLALYDAKAAGRNRAAMFSPDMREAVHDRFQLESDLRAALDRDELHLLYQPTVGLGSGVIRSMEALVRWRHPERGVLLPGEFLSLAEDTGAIVPIGRWVLRQACRQAAYWRRRGFAVPISVNVTVRQLDHPGFVDDVRHALADFGLAPDELVIEVSESSLVGDAERFAERLRAVKYLGVRIAIDDFGTGYASLAYLRRLPVDILKIDRSFVADVCASAGADALVRTLVELGRSLRLETVAEGIEHEGQRLRLTAERCDSGQGWLFSPPVSPREVEPWLAARRVVHPPAEPDGDLHAVTVPAPQPS